MSVRTLRVPWEISSAVDVRRALVVELRALEVDATVVEDTVTVISELVANAVHHAKALPDGMISVSWSVRSGVVEAEVTDGGGPTSPRLAPASLWSDSGRGLRIVSRLSHEWGVLERPNGRTVWACLGGPSSRSSI